MPEQSQHGAQARERRRGVRRHLVALFSDVSGSTRLGRLTDPEILDEILAQVKSCAERVITAHGGTVVQFHGDGVLAIFGYPEPAEDDVRRATEAALALHVEVARIEVPEAVRDRFTLALHSGIHGGLVLVRDGNEIQGRLELIGDAPNTASRISAHAAPGEILASRATLIGSVPFFETEVIPPLQMDDVPGPVPLYRVLARSDVRTRFEASKRRGLAPFIGREDVLGTLSRRLEECRNGQIRSIAILGDAGIGKTRTVEEFLNTARLAGATVLAGHCESGGRGAPLRPIQMMLRDAFDLPPDPVVPPAPEPVVRRLRRLGLEDAETVAILELLGFRREDGRRMGLPAVEVVGVNEILSAVETVLRAMSREAPLVMFVDDWQWADDLSRAASGSFGRALRDTPSLAMIAMRPTETTSMPDLGVETIELGPFREIESAQAIDALSPDGLDLGIARDLHERSGGNPLFLEELCRQRAQDSTSSAGSLSVPPTLSGLIERRVHSLPEPHAEVLRAAAVIGNLVPIWLLDEICEIDDLQPSLGALAAQDLLYPAPAEGTLRFKHGITRDTVYRSIKLVERRRLHTRAAAALTRRHGSSESELPLESLATHHEAAGDDENASLFAERAGDRAWKDASLDRARIQYLSALEALERLPDTPVHKRRWVDIANRCAVACVYAPTSERHLEMMGRAARLARELEDTEAEAIAHSWHGLLHYARGNVQASIERFDDGLGIAEQSRNEGLTTQLLANLGQSHAAACDYDAAFPMLERALGVGGRRAADSPSTSQRPKGTLGTAYALACAAAAHFDRGDVETAESWMDAALEAVRGTGHPIEASCLAVASAMFALSGRFPACAPLARRVQAMGQQMNGPYLYARGQADGAYARFMEHGRTEDLTTLRDSVEWLDARGIRLYLSIGLACLCEAMMEAGRFDEAGHYAERALERALEQDPLGEGTALRTLARLALRPGGGGPESAMRQLERAFGIADERGSARERVLTEATRAEILADIGDKASARDLLDETLPRLAAMRLDSYENRARALAQRLS